MGYLKEYISEFDSKISKVENALETVKIERKEVFFGNYVNGPEKYGVAEIDSNNNVFSIVEKPTEPKSNYAVARLYFYPNFVINIAKKVGLSCRGELEINSINQKYLEINELELKILSRGFTWLYTVTHEALTEAAEFLKAVEKRAGLKISCSIEIALNCNWISKNKLLNNISALKWDYYDCLGKILN